MTVRHPGDITLKQLLFFVVVNILFVFHPLWGYSKHLKCCATFFLDNALIALLNSDIEGTHWFIHPQTHSKPTSAGWTCHYTNVVTTLAYLNYFNLFKTAVVKKIILGTEMIRNNSWPESRLHWSVTMSHNGKFEKRKKEKWQHKPQNETVDINVKNKRTCTRFQFASVDLCTTSRSPSYVVSEVPVKLLGLCFFRRMFDLHIFENLNLSQRENMLC